MDNNTVCSDNSNDTHSNNNDDYSKNDQTEKTVPSTFSSAMLCNNKQQKIQESSHSQRIVSRFPITTHSSDDRFDFFRNAEK
eukprot:11200851-Ditylum_brightwellii.AAC.1